MDIITIIFAGLGVLATGDKAADVLLLNPSNQHCAGPHQARMTVRLEDVDLKKTTAKFKDPSIDSDGALTARLYLEGLDVSLCNGSWPKGGTLAMAQGRPKAADDISHIANLKRIWGDDKIVNRDQVTTTIHLTSGVVAASKPSQSVWTFKSDAGGGSVTTYDGTKDEGLSEDAQWSSPMSGDPTVVSLRDPKTQKEERVTFKVGVPITLRVSNLPADPREPFNQMGAGTDHFMVYYELLDNGKMIDLKKRPYPHPPGDVVVRGGGTGKCYFAVMSQ